MDMFPGTSSSSTEAVTDVGASTNTYLRKHWVKFLLFCAFPALLGIAIFCKSVYVSIQAGDPFAVVNIFMLVFVLLLAPVLYYGYARNQMRKLFYTQLAQTLHATYSFTAPLPTSGQLFSEGHDRKLFNVLSMTYQNHPFRLADYAFQVGSGDSRRGYIFTVGECTLGASVPRILCVPRSWPVPSRPRDMQPLSLEGNFNSAFTVYVPSGSEIEALQVLEPNTMAALMDDFSEFAFECAGTHVYVYRQGWMRESQEGITSVFALMDQLYVKLLPEVESAAR